MKKNCTIVRSLIFSIIFITGCLLNQGLLWAATPQVASGAYHTIGLRSDGTVVAVGYKDFGKCDVESWTGIQQVTAGENHTVGLKTDGTVIAVGSNEFGQCDVESWTDIQQVTAGVEHTVGLKTDGTVVAVGSNEFGQCDVESWTNIQQVSTKGWHTVGIRTDGTAVSVGYNEAGRRDVDSWTDIQQVDAGYYNTVGLKTDGTVVAVGYNMYGQCDVDSWTNIQQVVVGERHTIGLKTDGTVVALGLNELGQCDVESWADVQQVDAGAEDTVGLKADGTVVAVGYGHFQGLGNVYNWKDIQQVAAGTFHTVGLKVDGSVLAVGYNYWYQCNVQSWTDIQQVAAGENHTVGLKTDGTVLAVGLNFYGQCDVDSWSHITQVAAGQHHTVGLRANGTVVAVGDNSNYQCDVDSWRNIIQVAAGAMHTVGLKADGTVVAVGYNVGGPCNVDSWTDIIQVTAGYKHTVGLREDGSALGVGMNVYANQCVTCPGQCDVDSWTDIQQVAAGGMHTVGLRDDGTVTAVGSNEYGQCDVDSWTNIIQLAGGRHHTVGLREDGTVDVVSDFNEDRESVTDWRLSNLDLDGVPHADDNCPYTYNPEQEDYDGDGRGDACDHFPEDSNEWADSDGDGVGDNSDAFPEDSSEWEDTDDDGIGNIADTDDDNDGYLDEQDIFPLDSAEWSDLDGDGIGDNSDPDDDDDGTHDEEDNCPCTYNPEQEDSDGDGCGDACDGRPDNPNWMTIGGYISLADRTPLRAMVLANGQYMFTNNPVGEYSLDVPLNSNDEITLYVFCGGQAPFKAILTPAQASNYDITLEAASLDSKRIRVTAELAESTSRSGWVSISGRVTDQVGTPLAAMALANGQHMFTNNPVGDYSLDVPLDSNGKITLYIFCGGYAPFKAILNYDCPNDSDRDGICDDVDNCLYDSNPGQEDSDGNGIGDACDQSIPEVTHLRILHPGDTLQWDPVLMPNLEGYKVYYKTGTSGPPYNGTGAVEGSSPIDVGNTTQFTLHGLEEGMTYFFVVTVYNTNQLESGFSNEVYVLITSAEGDDYDGDGISNAEDLDDDNDGLPDIWEAAYGLDPLDSTGVNGGNGDFDGDGWSNYGEYVNETDPTDSTSVPSLLDILIVETIPKNLSGVDDDHSVPNDTSFAVRIEALNGIDTTNPASVVFTVREGTKAEYTRDLSDIGVMKVVSLTDEAYTDMSHLWISYYRSEESGMFYPYRNYAYDALVTIKVRVEDREGLVLEQAFTFKVENEVKYATAQETVDFLDITAIGPEDPDRYGEYDTGI